jgi:formylglycine-generating enzyme required for sulfatase activity
MAETQVPLNPYIAGSALDGPAGFFGREDVLRLVETELRAPQQNAVVLFGQRRIGKTSILLQLRRHLAESGFLPVYLDLMDRARRPLGAVLADLAGEVALELGLDPPDPDRFDDKGRTFRQEFLPAAYQALGEGEAARRLVFLFDEFDVLDTAAVEELPDTAAARAFFPYLRELMTQEKRLGFVIVVGRKTEELSTDFRAAFRAARYQRVSVLDAKDARALIHLAEEAGTLRFTAPAEQRILALTAGHPYFTQLTCFVLFNRAWAGAVGDVPQVTEADVDAVVPQVLEAGNNAFEWVWDGLPPAERIIFSAIAEGTEEGQVLDEDQIVEVLQEHGIRILIRELELAPRTLVEWEMLCRVDGGYRFFIELMRRWVERHKPLARVRDELDRVDVVADQFFQLGLTFYRQPNLEMAIAQLRQAIAANPNHFQARLLLGVCLRESGDLVNAVQELEWAYEYDAQAGRHELARTLLLHGERLEKDDAEDQALAAYERALAISPRERVARERRAAIYLRRGDAALEAGEYDAALRAYEQAGNREKMREAAARKRQAELAVYARRGEEATAAEDWAAALEVYEWLADQDPENARWHEAVEGVRQAQELAARYAEGLGAVEQQQWEAAARVLADVVYREPAYKEAAALLARAVDRVQAGRKAAGRKPQPSRPPEAGAAAPTPGEVRAFGGVEMVYVPAGPFLMGSDESKSEKPPHEVFVDGFWIDRTPVTNEEYQRFVQATGHSKPGHWRGDQIPKGKELHPVVYVNWQDAQAYCQWRSKQASAAIRLPTEAEWEKAARGADGRRYPWGDEFDAKKCNSSESGYRDTTPVGRYSPAGDSPYGLADAAGNVWEWTASLYEPYPYDAGDGREDPKADGRRVLRGGSWSSDRRDTRSAYRLHSDPSYALDYVGFRCARSGSGS